MVEAATGAPYRRMVGAASETGPGEGSLSPSLNGDPSRRPPPTQYRGMAAAGGVMEFRTIDRRFAGPPNSANGGYACGVAAQAFGAGPTEVTLLAPPPLDRPLGLERGDEEMVLLDGETPIAKAREWTGDVDLPAPVSVSEADAVRDSFDGDDYAAHHVFPGCFTCGPERQAGDGLQIFEGRHPTRELIAWPWRPDASTGCDGLVMPEIVWAALDCPSGFACLMLRDSEPQVMVLGRMAALIHRLPAVDEPTVVVAWPTGAEGRRVHSGVALFDGDGAVLAKGQATWITLSHEQLATFAGAPTT